MIIKVSEIADEGLAIDAATLEGSPFSDPAWRLEGLTLRLERDDLDVLVHGEIRATVPQVCGRCLERFGASVAAAVDVRVVPRPATAAKPLPKRRHSKTRGRKRRTHYKLAAPPRALCPQCREVKLPHRVCPHCGYYKGREIVAVEGA